MCPVWVTIIEVGPSTFKRILVSSQTTLFSLSIPPPPTPTSRTTSYAHIGSGEREVKKENVLLLCHWRVRWRCHKRVLKSLLGNRYPTIVRRAEGIFGFRENDMRRLHVRFSTNSKLGPRYVKSLACGEI